MKYARDVERCSNMNKDKILSNLKSFLFSFVWLMIVIVAADQMSKWIVQNSLSEGQLVPIIPGFFNFTLTHNVGAAFSLGANGDIGWRFFFIATSALIGFGLLIYFIIKYKTLTSWYKATYALIIAGALGNLVDRACYWDSTVGFNGVIDWIDFQLGSWHFATFNIADASLVVGVAILIIIFLVEAIKQSIEENKKGTYSIPPDELAKKEQAQTAHKADDHDESK